MDKKVISSIGIITDDNNKIITKEFITQTSEWEKFEYSISSEYSGEIAFKEFKIGVILKYDSLKLWDKSGNYIIFDYNKTSGSFIIIEEEQELLFTSKILKVFCHCIRYAFIQSSIDFTLQNSENPRSWLRKGLVIPNYVIVIPNPQSTSERDKEIISIESLPGHIHHMNYGDMLNFGSCWQMYFSPIYYKYIPKPLWDDYTECIENKVFENGLRRIILFENIEDSDLPESRELQLTFRRQLGIDSIAHELTKSNNRIEPENLPVFITKQNCKKGQTKIIRYLDKNNNLIASNLAVKKEIKEYLEDGIKLVLEKTEVNS
jgi:hypothetical protein